ncbi:MAG: hypothetical protein IBX66_10480, partial [Lutibacter sp.]|nr:hypothetical protein [Lutibacter sp.]
AASVKVLRVGLHPSEELVFGKSLVAGPIHPSFKEMVLTDLWGDILYEKLEKKGHLIVSVSGKQLNYAIGYKGKNRDDLKMKGYDINFVADSFLKDFELNVCYN